MKINYKSAAEMAQAVAVLVSNLAIWAAIGCIYYSDSQVLTAVNIGNILFNLFLINENNA